jgi:molybdopterin-containing oxidoreductase family iron-sulfur binding subunit
MDLGRLPPAPEGADPAVERWVDLVAQDLLGAPGQSLVVAGRRQPPEVHAAVFALNAALGNVGRSLTFHGTPDAAPSRLADLKELAAAMHRGAVSCLVVLGGNPAYSAPADLDFAGAMAKLPLSVHLGRRRDETGRLATWHLPETHALEAWGDARAVGGTASVIQPLIAPLHGAVSAVEVLGLLATGQVIPGHDSVRETWRGFLAPAGFETSWTHVLHDGVFEKSALPALAPAMASTSFAEHLTRLVPTRAPDDSALEIGFYPSPALHDGRFANNAWLQELPDPVTKITWDNAALVSPATAAARGLHNGARVLLGHAGRELAMAVWIVPGQADHTVAVHLGYGRDGAGRIGDGRGFNVYALRGSAALDWGGGSSLAPTGGHYDLAQTQDHGSMEGRPIVREADLETFRSRPGFAKESVVVPPLRQMWQAHDYSGGPQWGMSIDLTSCTGCNACVIACQSENNIPVVGKEQVARGREMHWIRVDRYFNGEVHDPETVFQPVPCMQCENAPCEQVCPVAATVHDREGLNTMVYNRCIGTRYCLNNCPYKVRRFNFFNFTKDTPEVQKMSYNPDVTVRSRGVMEKCTYCTQRINAAKIEAKLAGRALADGDIRTACEQACPSEAIRFGDIRDENSRVSRLKAQERDYVMLEELNNRPRTSYLAKLRNPHPELARRAPAPAPGEEHHG